MKKLIKATLSLTALIAILSGVWMIISKIIGEEEYDEEYDDYYMEEDDYEDLPKGVKKRGYFTIDLKKNMKVEA